MLYLEDYARAIALITGRAPDRAGVGVLTRFLARSWRPSCRPTTPSWPGSAAPPGRAGAATMAPVTYAYTRHLLDAAGRHGLATGLAAVLPCQWSYGEIATRLAGAMPADPVCADWISMFAGDGYDELVRASTALLDRHTDVADEALMTSPGRGVRPLHPLRAGLLGHGPGWPGVTSRRRPLIGRAGRARPSRAGQTADCASRGPPG